MLQIGATRIEEEEEEFMSEYEVAFKDLHAYVPTCVHRHTFFRMPAESREGQ